MICKHCGCSFEQRTGPGRKQKFCSEECQRDWWAQNREQHKSYTYICQQCGKEYVAKEKNRDKFCSRECAYAHKAKDRPENIARQEAKRQAKHNTKIVYAQCVECGAEFIQRRGRLTCSAQCQRLLNRRKYAEYAMERKGKNVCVCRECGKEFSAPYGDKRRGFCSGRCSRTNWKRLHPEQHKIQNQRRRARKYGNGEVQSISPREIFERDGWMCGICGKRVDRRLKFPHPKSASLDHIVPLAMGGTHTRNNVQLAHFICNSLKSANEGGQLRLDIDLT